MESALAELGVEPEQPGEAEVEGFDVAVGAADGDERRAEGEDLSGEPGMGRDVGQAQGLTGPVVGLIAATGDVLEVGVGDSEVVADAEVLDGGGACGPGLGGAVAALDRLGGAFLGHGGSGVGWFLRV